MFGLVSETEAGEQWADSLGELAFDLRYPGDRGSPAIVEAARRHPGILRQTTTLPDPECCAGGQLVAKDAYRFARREGASPVSKSGWRAPRTAPPKVHKHPPGAADCVAGSAECLSR